MPESEPITSSVQHYGRVLRRQWWVVLVVVLVACGAAAVYVKRAKPVYSASMKLVVGQDQTLFSPNLSVNVQTYTQTVTDLLQSQVVARETISRLGLQITPSSLLSHLGVSNGPDTSVVSIAYDDTNRTRAVRVLSTLGQIFTALVNSALAPKQALSATPSSSQPVSVVIFDSAHADPGRVSPKTMRTLLIAGVLGLVAGLLLAFLRDALSGRLRNEDEAEATYGAPVIGMLPRGALGLGRTQVHALAPKAAGRIGESFEMLTARLRYSTGLERGVILITGARPEDGKSTVAGHLAAVLATSGNDVIAVEGDLHRPALHRILGAEPGREGVRDAIGRDLALANLLIEVDANKVSPAALARAGAPTIARPNGNGVAHPNRPGSPRSDGRLRLLPAGIAPGNPGSLLALSSASPLVSRLRSLCDFVVIDTPPLLLSGDAYPLIQLADAVVVVCRERVTLQDEARRTRTILKSLGVHDFSLVISESGSAGRSDYYAYAAAA